MAKISFEITVPTEKQAEILDYFVRSNGWTDTVSESKMAAATRFISNYIREHYKHWAVKTAVDAARTSAIDSADAVIIG